ncbi:VOC family protein [Chitinophaga varians]|uniref:VOC family protein n=1 Tax=Chitinophaga varians TaxID=2202339 RepID=UPI00165FAAEA|nr:VOC family protein [Chitinophaga varians]MBC9909023.1 VOC family protein [Chitinophaga varians]
MIRGVFFLCLAIGSVLQVSAQTSGQPVIAGVDHIPVAVRDLDSAAARFKALGFALKPGRSHTNGIRNMHVKFTDGTELELITATDARDELTTAYRQHLAKGEGPAFLALYTPDKAALIRLLKRSGLAFDTADGFPTMAAHGPLPYLFFGSGNQSHCMDIVKDTTYSHVHGI